MHVEPGGDQVESGGGVADDLSPTPGLLAHTWAGSTGVSDPAQGRPLVTLEDLGGCGQRFTEVPLTVGAV